MFIIVQDMQSGFLGRKIFSFMELFGPLFRPPVPGWVIPPGKGS